MKALTICQPFAHYIVAPIERLPYAVSQKRVENRTWATRYRGPLLIHAGKSKSWMKTCPEDLSESALVFGAIVGVADLVACVWTLDFMGPPENWNPEIRAIVDEHRLKYHQHVEGPCCWVLASARRLKAPIPYRGAQGLFDVPFDVVQEQLEKCGFQQEVSAK